MAEVERNKRVGISDDEIPIRCRKKINHDEYAIYKECGDVKNATESLVKLIRDDNTKENRKELRELYKTSRPGNNDEAFAFMKLIESGIRGAKSDFAEYLYQNGSIKDAIHWYIEEAEYSKAFSCLDIRKFNYSNDVISEFNKATPEYIDAVKYLEQKASELDVFFRKYSIPPDNIFMKYFFLNSFYAIYRTYKLWGKGVVLGIFVVTLAITQVIDSRGMLLIMLWPEVLCGYDAYNLYCLNRCVSLLENLPNPIRFHPQMNDAVIGIYEYKKRKPQVALYPMLLAIFGCVFVIFGMAQTSNPKENVSSEAVSTIETSQYSSIDNADVKKQENKLLQYQQTDLSLGGIDVGTDKSHVYEILGKENSSTQKDGLLVLKYNHIDVHIEKNKVVNIISNTEFALTKKQAHQGMAIQDVFNLYGENFSKSNYDGLDLYEYTFKTLSGSNGILRFAVNSTTNIVEYIGARSIDELSSSKQTN